MGRKLNTTHEVGEKEIEQRGFDKKNVKNQMDNTLSEPGVYSLISRGFSVSN